jgi:rhodanese-related sulfurtransferase
MTTDTTEINSLSAYQKALQGAVFVDLRERSDVEQFALDVPNLVIVPFSEFESCFAVLPQDRDLVMICKGGGKSNWALQHLVTQGYTRVNNLQGGILQWVANGLPVKGNVEAL